MHFPSNVKQFEVYKSKGLLTSVPLPTKCGKSGKSTVALSSVTCKSCQSKIFPKGV